MFILRKLYKRTDILYRFSSRTGTDMSAVHCCHLCGATSYRPVLVRDAGAIKASGQYRCSGCNFLFDSQASWREGGQGRAAPPAGQSGD